MILHDPKFEISCVSEAQFPAKNIPEIAFVGRSNVGKSSLINALLNRKNIARAGGTPGITRMINFFNIDEVLYFVDLPGYGYASVSKDSKANWASIIETYLNTREQLKLIIMLVDIRHEPSVDDKMMYKWITSFKLPHVIIASKLDKIVRSKQKEHLARVKTALGPKNGIDVLGFSSESKAGKDELWAIIDNIILNKGSENDETK